MNYREMSTEELCLELKEKIGHKKLTLEFEKNHMDRFADLMEINKNTLVNIESLSDTIENQILREYATKLNSMIVRFHKDHMDRFNEVSDQIAELTQAYIDLKPRCNKVKLAYCKSLRSLRNFICRFA